MRLEHRAARPDRDAALAHLRRQPRDRRALRDGAVRHAHAHADPRRPRGRPLRRAHERARRRSALVALGNAVSLPAPRAGARVPRARDRRPRHGLRVRRRQRLHPRARRLAVPPGRLRRRLGARARASPSRSCRCSTSRLRLARAVPQRDRRRRGLRGAARARARRGADRAPRRRAARAAASSATAALPPRRDPRDVVRLQRDRRQLGRDAARAPRSLEERRPRSPAR